MLGLLIRFWDWIRGIEYDLELPPAWPMDKCWDCKTPTPPDCWQKFVEISGKQYSVPHCDACMEKEEEQIRAANRKSFGKDYPDASDDDPPRIAR